MKTKNFFKSCLCLGVFLAMFGPAVLATRGQGNERTNPSIPLIVMDNVPLSDAIKNLARQAGINFILDPRLANAHIGPDGKYIPQPTVSVRWENMTAAQALEKVATEHKLIIVTNPVTSVARIASNNAGVQSSPVALPATSINDIVPLIVMDETPLDVAIKNLAAMGGLKINLDPTISEPSTSSRTSVSFRWENLTAAQALAALLETYELTMTEDPATHVFRIAPKGQRNARPGSAGQSNP